MFSHTLPSDGIIDQVAVDRVVSGQASPTGGITRLTLAERSDVITILYERDMTDEEIAEHLWDFAGVEYVTEMAA